MATSTTPSLFNSASASSVPVSTLFSSPSPTGSSQQQSGPTANGSLYLFTFLTTLLLLLAVSFGIVLRSYVLRRRFRRRVEAAIAAGVLLPGSLDGTGGGAGRAMQEKPKLWEVWMDEEKGVEGKGWEDIMPISAQILNPSKSPSPSPPAPIRPTSRLQHFLQHSFMPPFVRPPPPPPPSAPPPSAPPPNPNPSSPPTPESVQLTFLIAMPSATRPRPSSLYSIDNLKGKSRAAGDEEEEELPEVCFGTTEVVWKGGELVGGREEV